MPAFVSRKARRAPALSKTTVRLLAERMLLTLELQSAELSVLLTDDLTIRKLNQAYRREDRPTDVLAFPLDPTSERNPVLLGDVVVSLETAQRQAVSRRRPLVEEVRWLLAHGLLHLLGYDHDTPSRKARMDGMTRRLVRAAAAVDPRAGPRALSPPRAPRRKTARAPGGKRSASAPRKRPKPHR